MNKARECPFCGSNKADTYSDTRNKTTLVICENCDAEGPPVPETENSWVAAITAWNTRYGEDE